jgi:hypothetical protein
MSAVLHRNLTIAQQVKKCPAFMEIKGSLQCPQEPVTGSYPD